PSRRSSRTPRPRRAPPGGSEELPGELAPVLGGAGVVGAEHLEQVDELLAGLVVALHPLEQLVEAGGDLVAVLGGLRGLAGAQHGPDPPALRGLGDAIEQREGLVDVTVLAPAGEQLG